MESALREDDFWQENLPAFPLASSSHRPLCTNPH